MTDPNWKATRAQDVSQATEVQWAWAAGLFEGEGCIYVPKDGSRGRSQLIVRMTDLDVMQRFHSIVGVGQMKPVKHHRAWKPHFKEAWEWRVSRWPDVLMLADKFKSHLGARRTARLAELLAKPRKSPKTLHSVCKRGHPLDGPNSDVRVVTVQGRLQRNCRKCRRDRKSESSSGQLAG